MLDLCRELATKPEQVHRPGCGWPSSGPLQVEAIASWLIQITSTKYAITTNKKIGYLIDIWSRVPVTKKTPERTLQFVELLPARIAEHRTGELNKLVEAFWKIVNEMGRSARRELLVGKEEASTCPKILEKFAGKLPPPMAVDLFFRILSEFEAPRGAYQFMQSSICKSDNGRHDALMQQVFERYLQKDGTTATQMASMFQTLLADARSRDAIQSAFDSLLRRLGDKMELGLLQQVVRRMYTLEQESVSKTQKVAERTPPATLPVPTQWARFVKLPQGAAVRADFLLHVLHSGTGEKELLGVALGKYGPIFYWEILSLVLEEAAQGPTSLLKRETLPPNLELLRQIDVGCVVRPIAPSSVGEKQSTEAVSLYFSMLEEKKEDPWQGPLTEAGWL
jgi:hypothetical protein